MENQNEVMELKKQMPKSVKTVLISCGVFVLMILAVAAVTGIYLSVVLQLLIWGSLLFFFAKGGRISRIILTAYLVLSILGILAAVIVPAVTNQQFTINMLIVLLVVVAPLITALISISKKTAVQYAGFCCPVCGSKKVKSKNFNYFKMLCKECGEEWV